jgi:hypothetical protein
MVCPARGIAARAAYSVPRWVDVLHLELARSCLLPGFGANDAPCDGIKPAHAAPVAKHTTDKEEDKASPFSSSQEAMTYQILMLRLVGICVVRVLGRDRFLCQYEASTFKANHADHYSRAPSKTSREAVRIKRRFAFKTID